MDYSGELDFGLVWNFSISWEKKKTSKKSRPSPTPFLQFVIKHAWTRIHLKICISYLVIYATCSTFQLCNPVFIGVAFCRGLNSAEHSWKDWSGREWKDLSAEHFGLSTPCHMLRHSSYRRNSCSCILVYIVLSRLCREHMAADLSLSSV